MIKKGNSKKKKVDSATRALLIRKGNQFFSEGKFKSAENIFIAVDYKDGLIRLGDYYLKSNNIYKSAEMYFLSENKSKIDSFCKKSALIIEKWLNEDKNKNNKDKEYEKIFIDKNKK